MWLVAAAVGAWAAVTSSMTGGRLRWAVLAGRARDVSGGWAEWRDVEPREQRLGLVHAVLNVSGLVLYGLSLMSRRRDRHGVGVALALGGSAAVSVGGHLGGHLTAVRKVSSRDLGFDDIPSVTGKRIRVTANRDDVTPPAGSPSGLVGVQPGVGKNYQSIGSHRLH